MHLASNPRHPAVFEKIESEDCSPSDILNSFKKIPVVVLKRHNIDKYLRTNSNLVSQKRFKLRECSVRLLRLNLGTISVPNATAPYLKCDVCEKIYYSEKKLHNHKQIKHELCTVQVKIPKKVTFCDQVTVFEPHIYHRCRKCASIFKNYTDLKSHTKHKHKKRNCYICHFCDKQFVDRMFFKVHIKLHCIICGLLFEYKHECTAHRKLCVPTALQQTKCNYCLQNFASDCILKYHIAVVHRKCKFAYNQLYVSKFENDSIEFTCIFCKYVSTNWLHFQNHVNILYHLEEKSNKLYQLLVDKSTKLNQLKQKSVLNSNNSDSVNKEEDIKELKKCNRVTITKDRHSLCDHLTLHGSKLNKAIPCYLNPIVLVRRTRNLEKYFDELYKTKPRKKRSTLEKSDHQCSICKKFFTSSYCLRRHVNCVHLDFENRVCRDCAMSFDWPSQLLNHKCQYWLNAANKKTVNNTVVDVTDDVVDQEVDDNYEEAMMIPPPIVELTEYDQELKFDKDGAMKIDNGLKNYDHNDCDNKPVTPFDKGYCNNNDNNAVMRQFNNVGLKLTDVSQLNSNKIMRINSDGRLVVNTGVTMPFVMTTMTPYQINNHFMTGDTQKPFQAVRYSLSSLLNNGMPQSVMPQLIPFTIKDAASSNVNGGL